MWLENRRAQVCVTTHPLWWGSLCHEALASCVWSASILLEIGGRTLVTERAFRSACKTALAAFCTGDGEAGLKKTTLRESLNNGMAREESGGERILATIP